MTHCRRSENIIRLNFSWNLDCKCHRITWPKYFQRCLGLGYTEVNPVMPPLLHWRTLCIFGIMNRAIFLLKQKVIFPVQFYDRQRFTFDEVYVICWLLLALHYFVGQQTARHYHIPNHTAGDLIICLTHLGDWFLCIQL